MTENQTIMQFDENAMDFHVTLKSAVFLTEAFMESGKPNMDCSDIHSAEIHTLCSQCILFLYSVLL